jgi:hypothetical protein
MHRHERAATACAVPGLEYLLGAEATCSEPAAPTADTLGALIRRPASPSLSGRSKARQRSGLSTGGRPGPSGASCEAAPLTATAKRSYPSRSFQPFQRMSVNPADPDPHRHPRAETLRHSPPPLLVEDLKLRVGGAGRSQRHISRDPARHTEETRAVGQLGHPGALAVLAAGVDRRHRCRVENLEVVERSVSFNS